MTNVEIGNVTSDLDFEDFILDRECVLKNNSIEQTAKIIVKEMVPSIQLRMMNLSETDRNNFIKMEIEKDNNRLSEDERDYYYEYVSDKFNEEIEERCLNRDLWSKKEEYKAKWKNKFPEEDEEMNKRIHILSQQIASNNIKMEEERKKKVVEINSKRDRERRLVDLVSTRKELIEGFDQFLMDQMDYDSEDVYEDLTLKVTKEVEQLVEKEASMIVKPYITEEVVESFKNHSRQVDYSSTTINTAKK